MNTKIVLGSLAGALAIHAVLGACTNNQGASADSGPAVQIAVENCDKPYGVAQPVVGIGGQDAGPSTATFYYAAHAYPGLTKEQLAGHVTNWSTIAANTPGQPSGFALRGQDAIYVADGIVGAGCSQGTTSTFIYAP